MNAGAINALPCNFQLIVAAIAAAAPHRRIVFRHELMKKATKSQTIRDQIAFNYSGNNNNGSGNITCLPFFFFHFASVSCNLRIGKYRVCHSLRFKSFCLFSLHFFFLHSLSTRSHESNDRCLKIISSFLKLLG